MTDAVTNHSTSSAPVPAADEVARETATWKNPHFPCFDAMRALGMLMVIAVHTQYQTVATKKGIFTPILNRMDFGVTLFFMLSGFLLYRPFVLATLVDRPQVKARTFLWRRGLRVLPGYWVALTFVVLFFGLRLHNAVDVVAYYGLLQPFSASRAFAPHSITQAWSLTAEILFYLMLPAYSLALRRLGRNRSVRDRVRIALLGTAVLYVIGVAFRVYMVYGKPGWQAQGAIVLPGWIDIIALGMAAAALSAGAQVGEGIPRLMVWLGDHPGWSWTLAGGAFFAITRVAPPDKPYVFTSEFILRYFAYGVIALLLLAPAMFGDQNHGRLRAVLRSRPAVALGTISLGVYLIHRTLLERIYTHLYPHGVTFYGGQGNFVVLYALTFLASVVYALLSYHLIEARFLRLKQRRTVPAPEGK